MISSIHNALVVADKVCNYIPCVSTCSNITNLFLKRIAIAQLKKQLILNRRY